MVAKFSDKESVIALLKCSPLFAPLTDALLLDMLGHFRRETWKRGRCVCAAESGQRFHVILSGRLNMGQINPDNGRAVTLFLLGPGDAFDVISLLDGGLPPASLEARDDLELLSTSLAEVRRWIELHPSFNRGFLPYLGQQMRTLADLAGDLALHDTETRLARLILRHVNDDDPHHSLRLIHDLSHESLGAMIGTVRVVVNRQLQHWQREGVIVSQRGKLMVQELEALLKKAMHYIPRHAAKKRSRKTEKSH